MFFEGGKCGIILICLYFSGDLEEMTKKYKAEQEKANILEARVASMEAQRRQQQEQSQDEDDSWFGVDPVVEPVIKSIWNFLKD